MQKAKSTLCRPLGIGSPGARAFLLLAAGPGLSQVATAWHGHPTATPPTTLPRAGGQGKLQARWARCPLPFVGAARRSQRFRPPRHPRDPPLVLPLSPDSHGDALRSVRQRVQRGPRSGKPGTCAPERWVTEGQGGDTRPLLTFLKRMKQADLRGVLGGS